MCCTHTTRVRLETEEEAWYAVLRIEARPRQTFLWGSAVSVLVLIGAVLFLVSQPSWTTSAVVCVVTGGVAIIAAAVAAFWHLRTTREIEKCGHLRTNPDFRYEFGAGHAKVSLALALPAVVRDDARRAVALADRTATCLAGVRRLQRRNHAFLVAVAILAQQDPGKVASLLRTADAVNATIEAVAREQLGKSTAPLPS